MIHGVALQALPDDVQVPEDLQQRFWYDPGQRRLFFDGFMSKYTYDRLEQLSSNGDYQLALEQLFRIAVPEDEVPPEAGGLRLAIAAATGVAAIGGLAALMRLVAG